MISAEATTLFVVLARGLNARGIALVACDPAVAKLNELLTSSGVRGACDSVTWVPSPQIRGSAPTIAAPTVTWTAASHGPTARFCDGLSTFLDRYGATKRIRRGVMAMTAELIHNVQSHAGAQFAAATALLHATRRPPVLQLGFSDDGVGIPEAILSQPMHRSMSWFTDAALTATVLHRGLSGRDEQTGGGMAHLTRRILGEISCDVMVRSGVAHITLDSAAPDRMRTRNLSAGIGTQVRLSVRLSKA